jgi:hypothetical protein
MWEDIYVEPSMADVLYAYPIGVGARGDLKEVEKYVRGVKEGFEHHGKEDDSEEEYTSEDYSAWKRWFDDTAMPEYEAIILGACDHGKLDAVKFVWETVREEEEEDVLHEIFDMRFSEMCKAGYADLAEWTLAEVSYGIQNQSVMEVVTMIASGSVTDPRIVALVEAEVKQRNLKP